VGRQQLAARPERPPTTSHRCPAPSAADHARVDVSYTLLLVEDDPNIRQALSLALTDEGYRIVACGTGEEAIRLVDDAAQSIDLVLLDLMLPGMYGLEVCRRLRIRGDLPIIIITARSDSTDVVAGLTAGADDYVTKPLVASELNARIAALMRRARRSGDNAFTIGEVAVDVSRGLATRQDETIHFTKTEFRLLCELFAADGKVVSREQLLDRVWDYDYFGDTRLLDVHIHRLRVKVETDPSRPQHILTVRGQGYRLST
jgi:DNA-binding response OmpR family regulator